jgi:hypothetical protein
MRKWIVLVSALLTLIMISGCGSNPDKVVKKQISLMNDFANAVENNASEDKIKDIEKRMKEVNKEFEALKLSDEQKQKLLETHRAELEEAGKRLVTAMMKKAGQQIGDLKFPGFGGAMPVPGQPPEKK